MGGISPPVSPGSPHKETGKKRHQQAVRILRIVNPLVCEDAQRGPVCPAEDGSQRRELPNDNAGRRIRGGERKCRTDRRHPCPRTCWVIGGVPDNPGRAGFWPIRGVQIKTKFRTGIGSRRIQTGTDWMLDKPIASAERSEVVLSRVSDAPAAPIRYTRTHVQCGLLLNAAIVWPWKVAAEALVCHDRPIPRDSDIRYAVAGQ